MLLPNEFGETYVILNEIEKIAWKSYRANYSFCYAFVGSKKHILDDLADRIILLDSHNKQDVEKYNEIVNKIQQMQSDLKEIMDDNLKDKIKNSINKQKDLKDEDNFTPEEIDELLNSLDDDKLETVYPTENVEDVFIPLDWDDIPSENPIQPRDLNLNLNLPK